MCNELGYGNSPKIFTGFFTSKFSAFSFLGISLKFAKCPVNFLDVVFQGMSNFIQTIHKDKSNIPPHTMWGINYNLLYALSFFIFFYYYDCTFVTLPNSLNTRITAWFNTHHIAISVPIILPFQLGIYISVEFVLNYTATHVLILHNFWNFKLKKS